MAVTMYFRLGCLGSPGALGAGIAFQDLTPPRRPRNRFPGPPGRGPDGAAAARARGAPSGGRDYGAFGGA
ncbi:hypothetical protein ADK60_06605 [Streptomyces sp. XY431]|nr:hypothetical protein VR45_35680 [Streptomyces sp. NRRL S-495]KOV36581.1 hypothetical protein ADK60_06605 [Streptomyces sp. XY431]